jgi:hypothetical protein
MNRSFVFHGESAPRRPVFDLNVDLLLASSAPVNEALWQGTARPAVDVHRVEAWIGEHLPLGNAPQKIGNARTVAAIDRAARTLVPTARVLRYTEKVDLCCNLRILRYVEQGVSAMLRFFCVTCPVAAPHGPRALLLVALEEPPVFFRYFKRYFW